MRVAMRLILSVFLLAVLSADVALAINVTADNMQTSGDDYILRGNVEIKTEGLTMKADDATYNNNTGLINATGNITIKNDKMEAHAERAHINAQSMQGSLFGAEVIMGARGYRITSDEVVIDDSDNMKLRSATVTTCTGIPAAWCIKGNDFDVKIGERLTAYHARLKLGPVPVIYLPYIWVPIIEARRTGFLVPSLGYRDTTGYFYRQPFFWAISAHTDATIWFEYHSEHAIGQRLEYRFLTGRDTGGRLYLRNLRDEAGESGYREGRLTLAHRPYSVPLRGISAGMDINIVNRQDYFKRYEDDLGMRDSRFLDSRAELWHEGRGHDRLYADGVYKYDLKRNVDNDTVLQKAGEVGYFIAPRLLGGGLLVATGLVEGANFERDDGYRGRRMRVRAEALHSMGLGSVNLSQNFGYEHMGYSLSNSVTAPLMEGGMSTGYGSYSARALLWARDYTGEALNMHTVEHSLDFLWLGRTGDEPLMLDLEELRQERSVVAYTLTNLLRGPQGEVLKLRLRQGVDVSRGQDKAEPFSADLSAASGGLRATVGVDYDYDLHGSGNMYSSVRYGVGRFNMFAGHIYDRLNAIETYRAQMGYRPLGRWLMSIGGSYDVKDENAVEEKYTALGYRAQCWSLNVRYIDRPDEYSVEVTASLMGLGEVRSQRLR